METVLIVAPREYDSELKMRFGMLGSIDTTRDGISVFDNGTSRTYLTRNDFATAELDPVRLKRITSIIERPIFYSVDFGDIVICRRVLMTIADDPDLLVDNDHGMLLTGAEFVRMLRSRQDWDWRTDPAWPNTI